MIKKSELRIGNYYQYRDKSYTRFGQIKNGADIDEMEDDDFEPIQISPEILEKAGFEDDRYWGDEVVWYSKSIVDIKVLAHIIEMYIGEKKIDINYLHQLQNLIFALSGEELTIQL